MRVLVTGHLGYIGPSVVAALRANGASVAGADSALFAECRLEAAPEVPTRFCDVRDLEVADLRGFTAVVHLANLSNDPLGALDPALTRAINVDATVRLAEVARRAGVAVFLNSSSCSVYGAAVDAWVDEETVPRPVTAYGESKLQAEQELAKLSSPDFSVVSLRNATAFGYSPNLRTDLVVNDLTAGAFLNGEVRLNSDGSAWRPLVHVADIAQAFRLALTAPPELVSGQVVNVGADEQNYRVLEIAQTVVGLVSGARLVVPNGAGADRRSYRVRFAKIQRLLPDFRCRYNIRTGIQELLEAFRRVGFDAPERFVRVAHLQRQLADGRVDHALRHVGNSRVDLVSPTAAV